MSRRGDWIQTATGKQFWPMDPRAEEIDIEDIAHSLSLLCRFGGHCLQFYSVAEHSVLISQKVSPPNRLWALLHDATETYICDVTWPVKRFLGGYEVAEDSIMAAICEHFDLDPEMPQEVKDADRRILMDERQQNMAPPPHPWQRECEPLGVILQLWSPWRAKLYYRSELRNAIAAQAA